MNILSTVMPKARKTHCCDYCFGKIKIGEVYEKTGIVNDGEVYTWKAHADCQYIASELKMFVDTYGEGLTGEDFCYNIDCEFEQIILDDFGEEQYKRIADKYTFVTRLKYVITRHKSKESHVFINTFI